MNWKKPLKTILLMGFSPVLLASQASAHVCEGTFTINKVDFVVDHGSSFMNPPGTVGGTPCPKHLFVEAVSVPGLGNVLAGITQDVNYSTPQGLIASNLSSGESMSDLTNSVFNQLILATDIDADGISGTLTDSGGSSKAASGIIFLNRTLGSNSLQCDSSSLNVETKFSDHSNNYDVRCSYSRDGAVQ